MLHRIRNIFRRDTFIYSDSSCPGKTSVKENASADQVNYIWCLVGNIVEKYNRGAEGDIQ